MDLMTVAEILKEKEWGIDMPGKYAGLDFDLVATNKPFTILDIPPKKNRKEGLKLILKNLAVFDAKSALVWQTHYDIMKKRATANGFFAIAELPQFLLGLGAKEMTAEALLMVKGDLQMFHIHNYNASAFVIDEENRLIYGHETTLKRLSLVGIRDVLI
jgi:hypothetical protein